MSFVFLSHNTLDKPDVTALGHALLDHGVEPWLDKWHLVGGRPWRPQAEQALREAAAVVICVGPHPLGPVQRHESDVAQTRHTADASFPVIPVLLPGASDVDALPEFLREFNAIDLREGGITNAGMRQIVNALHGRPAGPQIQGARNPYRGLEAYTSSPEHVRAFFGREPDVARALTQLRGHRETRALAIVALSGAGKSSFLNAGLVPSIVSGQLDGADTHWTILSMRPGAHPVREVAILFERLRGGDPVRLQELVEQVHAEPQTLQNVVALLPEECGRVLLVIDALEQLFTRCASADERDAFERSLELAATDPAGALTVVFGIRSDFLPQVYDRTFFGRVVDERSCRLETPSDEGLRDAILRPALRSGRRFQDGLVEHLVREVSARPGHLPLLQMALVQLWNNPSGAELTWTAFDEMGGIEGALAHHADAYLKGRPGTDQALLREIFTSLVEVGEDASRDVRRGVPRSDLVAIDPDRAPALLDELSDAECRLLVADEGGIELVSDVLVTRWPRLVEWIGADRKKLSLHRELRRAAALWKDEDGPTWSGPLLEQAVALAQVSSLRPNPVEEEFLRASRVEIAKALYERERLSTDRKKALDSLAVKIKEEERLRLVAEQAVRDANDALEREEHAKKKAQTRLFVATSASGLFLAATIAAATFAGVAFWQWQENAESLWRLEMSLRQLELTEGEKRQREKDIEDRDMAYNSFNTALETWATCIAAGKGDCLRNEDFARKIQAHIAIEREEGAAHKSSADRGWAAWKREKDARPNTEHARTKAKLKQSEAALKTTRADLSSVEKKLRDEESAEQGTKHRTTREELESAQALLAAEQKAADGTEHAATRDRLAADLEELDREFESYKLAHAVVVKPTPAPLAAPGTVPSSLPGGDSSPATARTVTEPTE